MPMLKGLSLRQGCPLCRNDQTRAKAAGRPLAVALVGSRSICLFGAVPCELVGPCARLREPDALQAWANFAGGENDGRRWLWRLSLKPSICGLFERGY